MRKLAFAAVLALGACNPITPAQFEGVQTAATISATVLPRWSLWRTNRHFSEV